MAKNTKDSEAPQAKEASKESPSLEELTTLLKVTQANLENYRKQSATRMQEAKKFALKDFISQLVPVLDSFSMALAAMQASKSEEAKNILIGVQFIHDQLLSVLQGNGVELITDAKGQFDPTRHEALEKRSSDKAPGEILELRAQGYCLSGSVIRPARVIVSAGTTTETTQNNPKTPTPEN